MLGIYPGFGKRKVYPRYSLTPRGMWLQLTGTLCTLVPMGLRIGGVGAKLPCFYAPNFEKVGRAYSLLERPCVRAYHFFVPTVTFKP